MLLCWFYCVPFAMMLYYAGAPLLVLFGLFMLRRGICRARPGLRQAAFLLFFIAALKLWVFDLREIDQAMACGAGKWLAFLCNPMGIKIIGLAGLVALCATCAVLFHFYRLTLHNKRPMLCRPEDAGLRRWANAAMTGTLVLVVWAMAPWVGSLTVGTVPGFFTQVPWQAVSLLSISLLLIGFWKVEGCDWTAAVRGRANIKSSKIVTAGWTPRDTLWTAVFLYLAATALAYIGHDVLS